MHGLQTIEQLQRELGCTGDVIEVLVERLGHPRDRTAADVAQPMDQVGAVASGDPVDQDALAQGGLRHDDPVDRQQIDDLVRAGSRRRR